MIWSLKLNQITSLKKSYYIRINSFQISFLFDLLFSSIIWFFWCIPTSPILDLLGLPWSGITAIPLRLKLLTDLWGCLNPEGSGDYLCPTVNSVRSDPSPWTWEEPKNAFPRPTLVGHLPSLSRPYLLFLSKIPPFLGKLFTLPSLCVSGTRYAPALHLSYSLNLAF